VVDSKESDSFDLQFEGNFVSNMFDYPFNYKITDLEILLDYDRTLINRNTYSLLEYLGDLGGLFDALKHLTSLVLNGYQTIWFYDRLGRMLFHKRKNKKGILQDFSARVPF
jgi:hypothetical protein